MTREIDIDAIKVGERHHKDMGDLSSLARSIAEAKRERTAFHVAHGDNERA